MRTCHTCQGPVFPQEVRRQRVLLQKGRQCHHSPVRAAVPGHCCTPYCTHICAGLWCASSASACMLRRLPLQAKGGGDMGKGGWAARAQAAAAANKE